MSVAWVVAWPDGKTTWNTEREAEAVADEMVKAKKTDYAVVYRINVEDNGGNAA